jgi:cytochrome b subunit of formate dehydrogenase
VQKEEGVLGMDLPEASSRPSRLGTLAHFVVVAALLLSFLSGALIWYGQSLAEAAFAPPQWLHACRVFHGVLNPLLCAVFGYLLCQHIRYGWALRANWPSGLVIESLFLLLILSGIAIYYADEGPFRNACVWAHRIGGAALPLVLALHWIASRLWVKQVLTPVAIQTQAQNPRDQTHVPPGT